MNLEEMKQKAIKLILKLNDNEKLEKVHLLLTSSKKEFTADEVFERTSNKFNTTLQKLAN